MGMILSLVGLLAVLSIGIWWAMQDFSRNTGILSPNVSGDIPMETPIDEARQAKELIESRSAQSLEP